MIISPNIQKILAAILVFILIIIGFTQYNNLKVLKSVNSSINKSQDSQSNQIPDTRTSQNLATNPKIIYIEKKTIYGYDDKTRKAILHSNQIPQLDNPLNDKLYSDINKKIIEDYSNSICVDIDDNDALQDSYNMVKSNIIGGRLDPNVQQRVSKDDMINLLSEQGYASNWDAKIVFINSHYISIRVNYDTYCGGAHPDAGVYGLDFDLDKGGSTNILSTSTDDINYNVKIKDIFTDYDKNKIKFKDIIIAAINDSYASSTSESDGGYYDLSYECEDTILNRYDDSINSEYDPFNFTFDKNGIYIEEFGLSHAESACEPYGVFVPYVAFNNLIQKEFIQKLN